MERRVPQELEGGRVVSVLEGDQLVTDESDMLLSTVLGSCVAVCARDPVAGVGGMNHFLLPGEDGPHQGGEATKRLLERIVAQGGRLDRIEVKLFGGADPSWKGARPGALNREFILGWLRRREIKPLAADLGGYASRKLVYHPRTGRAFVRRLDQAHGGQG